MFYYGAMTFICMYPAEHILNAEEVGKKFVNDLKVLLEERSCKAKIDSADGVKKITYNRPGTKNTLITLTVGRDVRVHIYADRINEYINDLMSLPTPILNAIKRGKACDVSNETGMCANCPKYHYEFTVGDVKYKKCRYENFKFRVNERTASPLLRMVMNEIK